jgi:hypothetical protein
MFELILREYEHAQGLGCNSQIAYIHNVLVVVKWDYTKFELGMRRNYNWLSVCVCVSTNIPSYLLTSPT